jgi:rod shape-determining protein MreD
MQRTIFIFGITVSCLIVQLLFARVLGSSLVPNFVLIAVVFFNLYRGLRYSLSAAFLGGFFLDSFSANLMGLNMFSLVMCAFLLGTLKKFIYQPGAAQSRLLMVFVAVVSNSFLQYFVILSSGIHLDFLTALQSVIMPEIILTLLVTLYTFERLKQCALKLFS